MNVNDKLKMMLTGAKGHGKEEVQERKRGEKSTPREEMLEDPKGRPIKVKKPFPFSKGK